MYKVSVDAYYFAFKRGRLNGRGNLTFNERLFKRLRLNNKKCKRPRLL